MSFKLPPAIRRSMHALRRQAGLLKSRLRRPNLYDVRTDDRVGVVFSAPSEMTVTERLFLYATVRGLRPERVLEIGSRHGGSASIMAAAMEDVGRGKIVGVDPRAEIRVAPWKFYNRFELVPKPSPEAIPEARSIAGGKFDFALIDGLHIYDQARKDLAAVLPHMNEGAHILLHDAFHFGLSEAVREMLEENPNVQDCGYVCVKPAVKVAMLAYGGFRMLRVGSERLVNAQPILDRAYAAVGKAPPPRDHELINHDSWYCRVVQPCEYCRRVNADKLQGNVKRDLSAAAR